MEQSETAFLKAYDSHKYEKPSVSVDVLIFALRNVKKRQSEQAYRLSILLIKRKKHPFMNHWAIPGGFVNLDESLKEAAYRELQEETNVKNVILEQLYTFGDVHRDPRMRVISVAYLAFSKDSDIQALAGDDAKEAMWFYIEKKGMILSLVSEDGNHHMQYRIDNGKLSSQGVTEFAFDHEQIFYMGLKRIFEIINNDDEVYRLFHTTDNNFAIDEYSI